MAGVKDLVFRLRLTKEERALLEKLAAAEDRTMSRALILAARKYAEQVHGIVTYEEETAFQGR